MARLRFPGRPGHRFDRSSIKYFADDVKNIQDPSLAFLPQFQRGLKAFRDIVGLSDEDEDFEGFTPQDLKTSERKLNAFIKEQKKKEQAELVAGQTSLPPLLPVSGKQRGKSSKKSSVSELASQVVLDRVPDDVFPSGRGVKFKVSKIQEQNIKPKNFKLDRKHGVPGAKGKRSEMDMAKFLLEKAKQANALQEQARAKKLAAAKSPVQVQKKTFVLPSQSSRSSRVIKPNKRFLEDDSFHSLVKKKSKPILTPNNASLTSDNNTSISKPADEKLCFSPNSSGVASVESGMGLLEQPLIVDGKRDRKPSLKLQLSDDDIPFLSPTQSSLTSPLAAPKLGTGLFSKSQFQKASEKQKLGMMGFGASRLHGASIVQKAKLQLNRAALNKSKAALARSLKAEMKREAKFAEQVKRQVPEVGTPLLSPSKMKVEGKSPRKWKRCLVCKKRKDIISCFGNLIACTSCKRFYREIMFLVKSGTFVKPICNKNERCQLEPDKNKCRYCRIKKLIQAGFPVASELVSVMSDEDDESEPFKQDETSDVPDENKTIKSLLNSKKAIKPPAAFPEAVTDLPVVTSSPKGFKKSIPLLSPPSTVHRESKIPDPFMSPPSIPPDPGSKELELSPLKAGENSEKKHRKKRAFKELLKNKQEKVDDTVDTSFERPVSLESPPQVVATGSVDVSPREGGAGPRIKHVCRNAAVVLGQPLATFPEKSELRLSALPTKDKVQLWKKDEESKAASADSDDERPIEDIIQQSGDSIVIMKKTPSKIKPTTKKLTGAGGLHIYKRKMRCKKCDGCRRQDCGTCRHCKDMKKYGGMGTLKKACELRRCTDPLIQRSATEAFIVEKKGKKLGTAGTLPKDNDDVDDHSDDDDFKSGFDTNIGSADFGSTVDLDSIIPGSQSSQTILGLETQAGTLLDDHTQSNNNVEHKYSMEPGNKSKNQSKPMTETIGPSSVFDSPTKSSKPEMRKLTFEDFQLERIAPRNKPGKIPSKVSKKLEMQEKYSKKQGGNDGQCYPVTLQSVLPASRQWGSLLSQPKYHPIKVDFKGKRDMGSCWKYGMALTLSSAMSVRTLCILCGSTGKHDMIYCNICCEPYHEFCLEDWEQPSAEHYNDWICAACQFCHVCGQQNNLLQCDKCQNTYHPGCLGPNYPTQPSKRKKIWICTKCVKCRSCGATTPGSGSQATWTYDFSLCYECGQLMDKGNFCPICHKCYSDDDWESKMIQCNKCDSWVHSKCEGLTDEMYEILSLLPEDLSFYCRKCFPVGCPEWETTLKRELQLGLENILHALIISKSSQYILKYQQKKSPLKNITPPPDNSEVQSTNEGSQVVNNELNAARRTIQFDEQTTVNDNNAKLTLEGCEQTNSDSVKCGSDMHSNRTSSENVQSSKLTVPNGCVNPLQTSVVSMEVDSESQTQATCVKTVSSTDKVNCDQSSDCEKLKSCDNNTQREVTCGGDVQREIIMQNSMKSDNSMSDTTCRQSVTASCDNNTGCDSFKYSKTVISTGSAQDTVCGGHNTECSLPIGDLKNLTTGCAKNKCSVHSIMTNCENGCSKNGNNSVMVINNTAGVDDINQGNNLTVCNSSSIVTSSDSSVIQSSLTDSKKSGHVHFNMNRDNTVAVKDEKSIVDDGHPKDLMEVAQKMRTGYYKSVALFCEDILRVIQTYLDNDKETRVSRKKAILSAKSIFAKQLEKIFPWFNVKMCRHWYSMKSLPDGMLPDATLPPSNDHTYAQWLERRELPSSPQPSPFKKRTATPVKKIVPIDDEDEYGLSQLFEGDDERKCMFCQTFGDQDGNDAGRLLYCGQDDWCHINCALWSAEVYEDEDGGLENLPEAFSRGKQLRCDRCDKFGATVGCNTRGCKSNFHFMCARYNQCRFQEDKKVFCHAHKMYIDGELMKPDMYNVERRVYVKALFVRAVKKRWSRGLHCADINVLIGSCCVEALGRLTDLSDLPKYLQPVDFIATRMYWSTRDARRRCVYTCRIIEVRPETLKSPTIQIKDMRIVHDPSHPDYVPITSLDLTSVSTDQNQSMQQSSIIELDSIPDVTPPDQNMEPAHSITSEDRVQANIATVAKTSSKNQDSRRASFSGLSSVVTSSSSSGLSKSWPITKPDRSKEPIKSGLSFLSPKTLKMLNISDPSKYIKPIQSERPDDNNDDDELGLLKIANRLNQAAAKSSVHKASSRSESMSPSSLRSHSRSPSVERITSSSPRFASPSVNELKRPHSSLEIRPYSPLTSLSLSQKLSGVPDQPFLPPSRLFNRSRSLSIERESSLSRQAISLLKTSSESQSLLSPNITSSPDLIRRGRSVSDPLNVMPEPINFSSPVSNNQKTFKAVTNVCADSEDTERSMEVDSQSNMTGSESAGFESDILSKEMESDVAMTKLDTISESDNIDTNITDDQSMDINEAIVDLDDENSELSTTDNTIDTTTETIVIMTESGESLSEEEALKIVQDLIEKKHSFNSGEVISWDPEVKTVVEGLVDSVDKSDDCDFENEANDNSTSDINVSSDVVNPDSPFVPCVKVGSGLGRKAPEVPNAVDTAVEINEAEEESSDSISMENEGEEVNEEASETSKLDTDNNGETECIKLDDDDDVDDDDIVDITDSVLLGTTSNELQENGNEDNSMKDSVEIPEKTDDVQTSRKRIVYDLDESIDSDMEDLDECNGTDDTPVCLDTEELSKPVSEDDYSEMVEDIDNSECIRIKSCVITDEIDGDKSNIFISDGEIYSEMKYDNETIEQSLHDCSKPVKMSLTTDSEFDSDVTLLTINDIQIAEREMDSLSEANIEQNVNVEGDKTADTCKLSSFASKYDKSVGNTEESLIDNCMLSDKDENVENKDTEVMLPVLDPIAKKIKEESIAKSCPSERGPFKCVKCRRMYRTESSYRVHVENCNFLVSSSDEDDNAEKGADEQIVPRRTRSASRNNSGDTNVQDVDQDQLSKRPSLRQSTQCQRLAFEAEEKRMKDDDIGKKKGKANQKNDYGIKMKECFVQLKSPENELKTKTIAPNSQDGDMKNVCAEKKDNGKLSARDMRRKSREIKIQESLSQSSDSETENIEQPRNKIGGRKRCHSKNETSTVNSKEDADDVSKSPVAKRKLRSSSLNIENRCVVSQEKDKVSHKLNNKEVEGLLKLQVEHMRVARNRKGKDWANLKNLDNSTSDESLKQSFVKLYDLSGESKDVDTLNSDKNNDGKELTKLDSENPVKDKIEDQDSKTDNHSDMEGENMESDSLTPSDEQSDLLDPETGWIVDKDGIKIRSPTVKISLNYKSNSSITSDDKGNELCMKDKCDNVEELTADKENTSDDNTESDRLEDKESVIDNEAVVEMNQQKMTTEKEPVLATEKDSVVVKDNNKTGDTDDAIVLDDDNDSVCENVSCDNNMNVKSSDKDTCTKPVENDAKDSDCEIVSESKLEKENKSSDKELESNCSEKDKDVVTKSAAFGKCLPVAVLKLLKQGHKVVIKNPKLDKCFIWQKTANGYVGKPFDKKLVKPTNSQTNNTKKPLKNDSNKTSKTGNKAECKNGNKTGSNKNLKTYSKADSMKGNKVDSMDVSKANASTSPMDTTLPEDVFTREMNDVGTYVDNDSSSPVDKPKSASEILLRKALGVKNSAQHQSLSNHNVISSVFNNDAVARKVVEKIDSLIETNKSIRVKSPEMVSSGKRSAEYVGGLVISPTGLSPESVEAYRKKIKDTVPIAQDVLQQTLVQNYYKQVQVSPVETVQKNHLASIMPIQQNVSPTQNLQLVSPTGFQVMHQYQPGRNLLTGVQISYGNMTVPGLSTLPLTVSSPNMYTIPKLIAPQTHQIQVQPMSNFHGVINLPVLSNIDLSTGRLISNTHDTRQFISSTQSLHSVQTQNCYTNGSISTLNQSLLSKSQNVVKPQLISPMMNKPANQASVNTQFDEEMAQPGFTTSTNQAISSTIPPTLGAFKPDLVRKMQDYMQQQKSNLNAKPEVKRRKHQHNQPSTSASNGVVKRNIINTPEVNQPQDVPVAKPKYTTLFPTSKIASVKKTDKDVKKITKKKKPVKTGNNKKTSGLSLPHKSGTSSHPITHGPKETSSLPVAAMEEEVRDIPLTAMGEIDGGSNTCEGYNLGHLEYEITSDDGFSCRADSLDGAWKQVTEKVQDVRTASRLKHLSYAGLSGLQLFGLSHPNVVYLIEQLYGASYIRRYKFEYHRHEMMERELELLNPTGCIRTEPFRGRNPSDMFSFLMSRYRNLPQKSGTYVDEEIVQKSSRRATSMDLPMAMRFRKLKEYSRECVGVYRSTIHGRGLFCKRSIDAGEMIIEYAGEVIRTSMTDMREKYYESKGIGCYMFRIDDTDVVDATMKGSAARFINHSCDPNCYSKVISVDNRKHIVIFAMKQIFRGEELTYDYKFPIEEVKIPCTCGSKKCRKYLN